VSKDDGSASDLFYGYIAGLQRYMPEAMLAFAPYVNSYLVIAATLACGYLGMTEGLKPTAEAEGSAYSSDFDLHRHIYAAIVAMQESDAMRSMFGDEFVSLYTALKEAEFSEFQEIITPYERETLMFNV
jgi:glutamine synthetase